MDGTDIASVGAAGAFCATHAPAAAALVGAAAGPSPTRSTGPIEAYGATALPSCIRAYVPARSSAEERDLPRRALRAWGIFSQAGGSSGNARLAICELRCPHAGAPFVTGGVGWPICGDENGVSAGRGGTAAQWRHSGGTQWPLGGKVAAQSGGKAAQLGGTAAQRRHSGGTMAAQSGGTAAQLTVRVPLPAQTGGTAAQWRQSQACFGATHPPFRVTPSLCQRRHLRPQGSTHTRLKGGVW
eukprot:gene14960-biopygen8338